MGEERKTAQQWEEEYKPKGLIIHNHHGFGSGYYKDVDPSYYNEPITLDEFKSKLMLCTLLQYPKELMTGDPKKNLKTYYRLDIDGDNYGVMPIREVAEVIGNHLEGGLEEGETCEVFITPKQMTEEEYNNLPEVEL